MARVVFLGGDWACTSAMDLIDGKPSAFMDSIVCNAEIMKRLDANALISR